MQILSTLINYLSAKLRALDDQPLQAPMFAGYYTDYDTAVKNADTKAEKQGGTWYVIRLEDEEKYTPVHQRYMDQHTGVKSYYRTKAEK